LDKIGHDNKYGLFDKVKFMAKLKYDYNNAYDRRNLLNTLWVEYKKTNKPVDNIF
jgi:hypothetical protein